MLSVTLRSDSQVIHRDLKLENILLKGKVRGTQEAKLSVSPDHSPI